MSGFRFNCCRRLFTALTPVEAQTLMGNLTGILVNAPPSRDVVLQILTKLVETHPQKLLMFAPHLMVRYYQLQHLFEKQFPSKGF